MTAVVKTPQNELSVSDRVARSQLKPAKPGWGCACEIRFFFSALKNTESSGTAWAGYGFFASLSWTGYTVLLPSVLNRVRNNRLLFTRSPALLNTVNNKIYRRIRINKTCAPQPKDTNLSGKDTKKTLTISKYHTGPVLFAHADWLARRWLAIYLPPSSRRKTKWLLSVYCLKCSYSMVR